MKPTPEQMERAVTALVPYVQEWELSLNPEDLYELAGAVLAHFDTETTFEEIDAHEREQIKKFTAAQKELYRDLRPDS